MVRMAHNIRIRHVSQQLVEPVASLVVPSMVSRESSQIKSSQVYLRFDNNMLTQASRSFSYRLTS